MDSVDSSLVVWRGCSTQRAEDGTAAQRNSGKQYQVISSEPYYPRFSRLCNHFTAHRHLSRSYLNLLQFFLNRRRFMRNRRLERKGKSPR
jgi:hypothetical protein